LSTARWPARSQVQAADPGDLAFSAGSVFASCLAQGLIKLRGDPCWRDLTCLTTITKRSPIQNPVSRYLHFAPLWFHKFEVIWNHFVELIRALVFFRSANGAATLPACCLVTFQIFLIISGNLSFLNYLTIIPFLACFDDTFLGRFLPRSIVRRAQRAAQNSQPSRINNGMPVALTISGDLAQRTDGAQSRLRPAADELLV
jgi:hypothetical protein